jgi:hypothetical protein
MFCSTLCVAFVLLWVRSYWWCDTLYQRHRTHYWQLQCWKGSIDYQRQPWQNAQEQLVELSCLPTEQWEGLIANSNVGTPRRKSRAFIFSWGLLQSDKVRLRVPHWFLAVLAFVPAIALKPKPRYRVSLLDFLVLTTFAAMLAALVAWLVRLRA